LSDFKIKKDLASSKEHNSLNSLLVISSSPGVRTRAGQFKELSHSILSYFGRVQNHLQIEGNLKIVVELELFLSQTPIKKEREM